MIKTDKTTSKKSKRFKEVKIPKKVKLQKGEEIPMELLKNYYIVGTPGLQVPAKLVDIAKNGKIKLVDTLTKTKNIKRIKGKPVISISTSSYTHGIKALEGKTLGNKRGDVIYNEMNSGTWDQVHILRKDMEDIQKEKKKLNIKKDKDKIKLLDDKYNNLDKKLEKIGKLYDIYSRTNTRFS